MTGRWTYRISAGGVLVLAAAAFTLSYDALHHLALNSRVRSALAWLWPVVIDGTIVVALLTVLAAKRAATRAAYPWLLAGLFSAASVAFNIAPAPARPVAQLVFAMAPVALVLTTHLLMQQASWRLPAPGPAAAHEAEHPNGSGDHPAQPPTSPSRAAHPGARARVWAAYKPSALPGRPRPAPASRERRASANGTGNACSPSSSLIRPEPRSRTATASRRRGSSHPASHTEHAERR
jgi:Protein of unknown function (DUF2637)